MKNQKNNKRMIVMLIVLLGLLVLAVKIMFFPSNNDLTIDQNIAASQRVEGVLNELQSINFNTTIMDNPNFKSLKSIESSSLSLPVGRKDPFSQTSGSK